MFADTGHAAPSHLELMALVEHAPDGIFLADAHGRYTYVNEAGCRLLGCSREDIVGKTILDLIPAEQVERLWASREQMVLGARSVAEWNLRHKDGSWVPVEVSANILPDGQWQGFVRDISERKAHEAEREALLDAVDAERDWLRAVLDTLPLGVILMQAEGKLSCNSAAEALLGVRLDPYGGSQQYSGRVFYPDGRPVPAEELLSARALGRGETVIGKEFLVRRDDGSGIPIMGSAAAIRDAGGAVTGSVCVLQNLTERVHAEERIRSEQRLLQAIFEILPVGIWIADQAGRIVRNNPAGERIWGGARYVPVSQFGEYKGWWIDSGKPIAAEEWALARALTKGETSAGELVRIQCFDGSFKTIINSAAPLRGERGELTGAIVVNEDITALHEAQEKLRASEQLLRTVFELLPVGLWIADREGRIVLANPAGERIWQGARYVGPERYGEYKGWWLQSGKPIEPDDWGVARAIRHGETSRAELIRIQCFDGSYKTIINWAAPIRSNAGEITGAIALNEDVTALQQTQEQLRAAVRDREELLAIVSHDLRSPLASIMVGAGLAERQAAALAGGEPVRAVATRMLEIARRTSRLVDDLLAVAVAHTGRPVLKVEPVPPSLLLAKAAEAAGPLLAREGLELEVCPAEGAPAVSVDVDRILRVFSNLLDNAAKFTTPPGRVTLAAEPVSGGVRFSVANTGPALAPAVLQSMFLQFWQAREQSHRGAGLGLSICRALVEAHGGSIWAEPAEGQRVRVCFVLPRC